ncbi:MAG: hypothetical protein KDC67_06225, partial [Ignavibacteriae bacterium]|nr:hypothetical protein [Ignavibacteriota bacterium]
TRFIEHKHFLKLCSDLDINQFSLGKDEQWLELQEKEKILFPVKRIIYPRNYLKTVYKIRNSNRTFGSDLIEVPEKHKTIHKLYENINYFDVRNSLFHVFDTNKAQYSNYIKNPLKLKFKPWKEYKFKVGNFRGHNEFINDTRHYYSYWQAYYFYEITQASKLELTVNHFNYDPELFNFTNNFPRELIFNRRFFFRKSKVESDFLGQAKYFDILSFYIQTKHKLGNFVYGRISEMFNEKRENRYKILEKKIARFVLKKYVVTEKELFDFLTFLCQKYDLYKRDKKEKLTEMLRLDINRWISLMTDGLNLEYEQINKKLGRVITDFRNTLDVIFPKPFAEERENVLYTLSSALTSKISFYRYNDIPKEKVEEFFEFLEKNNLHLFYYSLGQINISMYRDTSVYIHVFYLSLLFENILKKIGRNASDTELVDFFNSPKMLKQAIVKYYNDEDWSSILQEKWKIYTSFSPSLDVNNRLFHEIKESTFSVNENNNNIIKMFLTCGLARNLSAHEHSKVFTNDIDIFLTLVNNVVAAIWFTYKYALDKGLISKY